MALDPSFYPAFKTDIQADPAFASLPHNSDGAFIIADAYNKQATPAFTVWRSSVTTGQVGGTWLQSDVANLTTANTNRLGIMEQYSAGAFNPSKSDVRQSFNDIFSVASASGTRAALLVLWKRLATRAEKLFADLTNGNGTDATPATMKFEGSITISDVLATMGW